MLTCIACSKQPAGASLSKQEEGDIAATPSTKETIKSLTTQIKDIALKASGAYKHCNPCSGSSAHNQNRNYADYDAASVSERFHCSYRRTGSPTSTPRLRGKETEARMKGLSSGEATPASVSGRSESVVFVAEDEPKEWVAQVEPGILITFISLPSGGNYLKRIQFRLLLFGLFILSDMILDRNSDDSSVGLGSREMFNKCQAQRWWAVNYDKVMELYNVQRFNQQTVPLPTPPSSEGESSKIEPVEGSPATPPLDKERLPHKGMGYSLSDSLDHHLTQFGHYCDAGSLASAPKHSSVSGSKTETLSANASKRTSSSREADHSGEMSISNASDLEAEWVEQDEPGIYISIRALPGGTRELARVRFR
ncbi:hypothetical protein U1Q18_006419 [Sarracenia purpurea var. burkii]